MLGAAMATMIGRGLVRQLGGEPRDAARIVQAITDGDLATPVPVGVGSLFRSRSAQE